MAAVHDDLIIRSADRSVIALGVSLGKLELLGMIRDYYLHPPPSNSIERVLFSVSVSLLSAAVLPSRVKTPTHISGVLCRLSGLS